MKYLLLVLLSGCAVLEPAVIVVQASVTAMQVVAIKSEYDKELAKGPASTESEERVVHPESERAKAFKKRWPCCK